MINPLVHHYGPYYLASNVYITNWKDPAFYSWVNELTISTRVSHFQSLSLTVYQRLVAINYLSLSKFI